MKIINIFVYLLFVYSAVLMAQPEKIKIKTIRDYEVKGNVKQVIVDDLGPSAGKSKLLFTPEGYIQFDGWLKEDSYEGVSYTYDKAGHLLKEDFGVNAKTYSYNSQGLLIKKTNWYKGKVSDSESYLYDTNGYIRQRRSNGGKVYAYKNRLDSQKRLIKIEEVLQPSNLLVQTTNITYLPNGWSKSVIVSSSIETIVELDDKGRERSKKVRDPQSGQGFMTTHTYDNSDNCVESRYDNEQTKYTYNTLGELTFTEYTGYNKEVTGSKQSDIKYTYTKHDAKGNWTERIITYLDNNFQKTERRSIEYYE
ncbi:hypothetical protein [Bacteroides thetaiotaomicron]|uniref:hypothetical protein n=1 Tax=Bacteroides thetaiotaomicron TaxID=818 RepID=UPI0028F4053A|nr:hypothetical protein [Bacteroides thetaiotaomicron]WOG18218.1 hypothetical protein RJT07_13675 [Bacteroides thetaiotaomicron]